MNNVSPNSKTPSIKEESKSNQGDNLNEQNLNVNEIISNSKPQEIDNKKKDYKDTTTREESLSSFAFVIAWSCLVPLGIYIAFRPKDCPPIQGQVKLLPPKTILSN